MFTVYETPITNGPIKNPVAVFFTQSAVTVIVQNPSPRTSQAFTVLLSPAARMGMMPSL
jgi:hypothetical protein